MSINNAKESLKKEYEVLIDYIAQHQDEIQDMLGEILNDPNFFKEPIKVKDKIEKFLHDKKFKESFDKEIKNDVGSPDRN